MSCSPCTPAPSVNGQAAGGGSGGGSSRNFLFRVGPDIESTDVFPAIETMISAAIPANTLAVDGDFIEMELGGNVFNAGPGSVNVTPAIGIDAVFGWVATSGAIPAGTFSWSGRVLITRKTALTFSLAGRWQIHNVTTAITGLGSLALANLGGPIAAPQADPACNWAVAQNLIFNMTATAASTFRIKVGYAEVIT